MSRSEPPRSLVFRIGRQRPHSPVERNCPRLRTCAIAPKKSASGHRKNGPHRRCGLSELGEAGAPVFESARRSGAGKDRRISRIRQTTSRVRVSLYKRPQCRRLPGMCRRKCPVEEGYGGGAEKHGGCPVHLE